MAERGNGLPVSAEPAAGVSQSMSMATSPLSEDPQLS